MKKPLDGLVEKFEQVTTQLLEMRNEIIQYKNLYEKSVRVFFELVHLNDPKIDVILTREGINVTGPDGRNIFPRPHIQGPKVIFDDSKN